MKITKNTLKQLIREEINEIGLPEPELDPESPFARFYEIMDGHGEGWGLIDRVERCIQDPAGAGKCSDISNAASDALYELRRNMSSENHDRFRPLWAALAYLSDIPQNPEVHAGWKLNPRTIEDLKSGFEIFKQEKPHRSIALEEKKITKKQLTQIILEEFEGLLAESAEGAGFRYLVHPVAKIGLALWMRDPDAVAGDPEGDLAYAIGVAEEEIDRLAVTKATSESITAGIKQHTPRVIAQRLCVRNAAPDADCDAFLKIRPKDFPKGN